MNWQAFLKIFTLLYVVSMVSSQGILEPAINAANGLRDKIGTALDALKNGKPLNLGFIQIPGRNGNNKPNIDEYYNSNRDSSGSSELNRDDPPYNNGYHNHHPHGGPPGHFPGRGPPGRGPPGRYPYEQPYGRYPDQDRYSDEGPPDRYPERDGYPNGQYPDRRPSGHNHHHHHHHHHPPSDDFDGSPPYNRPPHDGHQNNGRPQRPNEFERERPRPNFGDQPNYNGINNNGSSIEGIVLNEDYDETDSRNGNNIVGYLNKFPVILLKENEIR